MSTDFENRLRDDLHSSTVAPLEVDLDAVMAQGRAGIQRRTLLRGGFAAVVLGAAAVAAPRVLGRPDLFAGPAETPTESWHSVELARIADVRGVVHSDVPAVTRVEVNPTAAPGSVGLRYRFSEPDGSMGSGYVGGDSDITYATWGTTGESSFVVGVLRGVATKVGAGSALGSRSLFKPIPQTPFTAFVLQLTTADAAAGIETVYWVDEDGTVVDSAGGSYEGGLVADDLRYFFNRQTSAFGFFEGDTCQVLPHSDQGSIFQASRQAVAVAVLPPNVGDVSLVGPQGWTLRLFASDRDPSYVVLTHDGTPTSKPTVSWKESGGQVRELTIG